MALESAVYLDTLNVSNPSGSDPVGQSDDHIRLLKGVLKNTFPNINGVVSATPLQLSQGTVPTGLIAMWSGDPGSLPTGWKLCDGGTYAKADGSGNITAPDLRNKFILSSGGSSVTPAAAPTVGSTGGSSSATPTITVGDHYIAKGHLPNYNLNVNDPSHGHSCWLSDPGHTHGYSVPSGSQTWYGYTSFTSAFSSATGTSWVSTGSSGTSISVGANNNTTGISVNSGGSGSALGHSASSSAISTVPPYYVLAFIIKV